VTGFDFLRDEISAATPVSAQEARELVAEHFGPDVRAHPLGSQQDTNLLLTEPGGRPLGVLKIANAVFTGDEVAAQDTAAELLAGTGLRTATVEHGPVVLDTPDGPRIARVLRHLGGGTLTGNGYLAPPVVAAMGRVAGQVSTALAAFDHPGLDRSLQWDLRFADVVVDRLARHVVDPGQRALVQRATADAWARLPGDLPRQAVHLDLTDDNVVCSARDGRRVPDGVIDLGDLARTWAVAELAVTISSVLHHAGSEPASVLPAARAFHALRPLSAGEVEALWPLVVLRGAVLVVSGHHQAAIDTGNAYALGGLDAEWEIFAQATSMPVEVMTALLRDAVGLAAPPLVVPAGKLLPETPVVLDLTAGSDAVDGGAWLLPDLPDRLATAFLAGPTRESPHPGARVGTTPPASRHVPARESAHPGARIGTAGPPATVVTEYGRPRLAGSPVLSAVSPPSTPTGIDLWTDSELRSPWAGTVAESAANRLVVATEDRILTLAGQLESPVDNGTRLAAGDRLADARGHVHIGVRRSGSPEPPPLVRPGYAPGWLALTADPGPLLGLPPTVIEGPDLLARRTAVLAGVQEHYYDAPPRIERGWRHHLAATDGRVYLDMVNNVAVLGHAHPRVEAAVARQLRRLNTNSRFHYAAVVELAERLAGLLPDPLDTVFLVNSGSEAVDLAIRLAMAATGRRDVVAVREAYHGWTYATDAVSTSVADNPNAPATRPDWVHTVAAPYRGGSAAEAVAVIDQLAPAAFVTEAIAGNAGGIALPDGYLAAVYAAVRRRGGLAIADEVQVGYGRLGHWFWGFEQQGVVPDIVAVAKAMGNGHPLGAVVTSRAVADRYREGGYFFSSTGGSPVSCVVGTTVLDVLRDEDLMGNAARVGAHLKARLEALDHDMIAAVHGFGLYLGVELVREAGEPATEETAAICDRLLELGVVMQPTGDGLNVLKIKPPLCVDEAAVDYFVDMLARVLTDGW
jgi:4-aminobutyrate aminotransferase-like enzyme/Ser/Thr protein kinase RdoA (MazF antagonist)